MPTDVNSGPDPNEVQKAKELCEDLLANVREQYEEFKNRPPPQRGYGGQSTGYGGERGYGDRAPDRSNSYGGSGGGYGGYNSPAPTTTGGVLSPTTSAPGAGTPTSGADYAAQYAQYYAANGQTDPYAAYGKSKDQTFMLEHTNFVQVAMRRMSSTTSNIWRQLQQLNSSLHQVPPVQLLHHHLARIHLPPSGAPPGSSYNNVR